MQANYDKCLETILHHEGGYVNHPKDPGETNLGKSEFMKNLKDKRHERLNMEDATNL